MQALLLPVMLLLLYMTMIRPQQRRQAEARATLSKTSVGDRVLLTSGLYGVVLDVNGDVLKLGVSPDLHVYAAKAAVARRLDPTDEASPPVYMLASEEDQAALPVAPTEPTTDAATEPGAAGSSGSAGSAGSAGLTGPAASMVAGSSPAIEGTPE